ncbi:MAG: hypothetical protein HOF21_09220 [Nitrospina sp.]|jgi:hypothetical protein|nr:hypothetical protein [Nitrospina sp.]MBT5631506.1 hypothetical protein [Nitrospina sp.]
MLLSKFFKNHDPITQRLYWAWVLAILLIFGLFRFPGLGVPLVSDELATVSLWAQMPTLKIFTNYQYPNNHIFLTFILSFLLKTFGLNEWLLRVPLIVCGIVTLYLGYQLGRKISGSTGVGISTAFLMAVSEEHTLYSTYARGYIVTMMLALMAVVYVLDRLEDREIEIKKSFNGFNGVLAFSGWVSIWVIGTWMIPTFLFFEVSIAIFLIGILIVAARHYSSLQKRNLVIPLASTAMGAIGFYIQYYVLISPEMLAEATSNVSAISYSQFFPELLVKWTSPFEFAGTLFLLLALLGLVNLLQQNRTVGFLLVCVWLGPIFFAIAGFVLGKLPTLPYSRTFFYLQPFFLMLCVMGARNAGAWMLRLIRNNSGSQEKEFRIMTAGLAGVLCLISGLNFSQKIYPQRMSKEPINKVHDFVDKLSSNDLLLVSNKMHVKFYLYGAREMRDRIENILREGKLGDIYFLDYDKRSMEGTPDSINKEAWHLYLRRLIGKAEKEGPAIPEAAVEIADRFGPFTFYRLKRDWLRPIQGWERAGLNPASQGTESFRWEKVSSPSGVRPLIRFEDSFTVAMKNREPQLLKASGLTLSLVEIAGNDRNFSAALLRGRMKKGDVDYDPSWRANAWTLDHPYGSEIFSRPWNPAIFISQGAGGLSVIDVSFNRRLGGGALRNFLSYRIEEPKVERK